MKLWLVSRPEKHVGYDEFDSMIVAANDSAEAMLVHPRGGLVWRKAEEGDEVEAIGVEAWLPLVPDGWHWADNTWGHPSTLTAAHVGESVPKTEAGTVLLASFNAG